MKHTSPTPMSVRLLYPLQQVAEMLSLSRETLYRRIRQGLFPEPIKQGNRSYYRPEDVNAYLKNLNRRYR